MNSFHWRAERENRRWALIVFQTRAIANYWRSSCLSLPSLHICVANGEIRVSQSDREIHLSEPKTADAIPFHLEPCFFCFAMALERNSNGAMTTEADTKNDTDSFFDSIPGMTEEVGPARPDQSELYKKDRIQRRNTTRPQKRQGSSGESKKETTNGSLLSAT